MNTYHLVVLACISCAGILAAFCTQSQKDVNFLGGAWKGKGTGDINNANIIQVSNSMDLLDLGVIEMPIKYFADEYPNGYESHDKQSFDLHDKEPHSLRLDRKLLSVNVENYSSSPTNYGITVSWGCKKNKSYNICWKKTSWYASNPCWYNKATKKSNRNGDDCFYNINNLDCGVEYKFKVSRTWFDYGLHTHTIKPCA